MRHLGIVASSIVPASPPSVSINSTTNFNQDRATFNGTVSANGAITTTIKFQISTNNSTWSDASGGTTISNTSSDNVSVFYNATGLSNGTLYYVRLVATNSMGTATSSSTTFTTWSLKTYASATPGTSTLNIPTITPTNGTAVIPSIYNVFILGGGGGGQANGGAGGGYRLVSSRAFSSTANTQLTLVVGKGGDGGRISPSTVYVTSGDPTQIYASNFTSIDAGGGAANQGGTVYVGYGDNPAYRSGYSTSYTAGGKNDPIWYGYGGGAGIGGQGGDGAAGNGYGNGGSGGAGGSAYGYSGGAGGAGYGTTSSGSNGSNYGYGSGGSYIDSFNGNDGSAGLIRFQYFGP